MPKKYKFHIPIPFISVFLILILFFYWIIPFSSINFGASSSKNFNFSTGVANTSMQFYPNMRYPTGNISYTISNNCPVQKSDEATRAIAILQNSTVLNFYSVPNNGEISISCQNKNIVTSRNTFIAGEGGPTGIVESGSFNVIFNGTVLLIRDSNCPSPNIAIHEILHALGFIHSTNPNNVMYPITSCDQTIGQDTIDTINSLYSFSSLPDLLFENASATVNGRFINVNFTVRNFGLADAPPSNVGIYADGKNIKNISIGKIEIGDGTVVNVNGIFTLQSNVKNISFFINTNFSELDKENNEVTLNYTN